MLWYKGNQNLLFIFDHGLNTLNMPAPVYFPLKNKSTTDPENQRCFYLCKKCFFANYPNGQAFDR